jgi:cell wall-associated NlpC family hydrolase
MISQRVFHSLLCLVAVATGLAGCAWEAPSVAAPERAQQRDVGGEAASVASRQVGVPYRYGGRSPSGFDCSGLVQYAYAQAGISVPRTTSALWQSSAPVARSDLRAGDVLFFNVDGKMSHVGLYLGGERFVHAPSSGREVSIATLDSPYYSKAFIRAGRLPR